MGTRSPQAAASGASTSEILSPTPPVECLSTRGPGTPSRFITSPEAIIALVRRAVSAGLIPFRTTAMSSDANW